MNPSQSAGGEPVQETVYTLPGAPRLAVLGDFHGGDAVPVLRSLKAHRPDIIAVPGDLVYGAPPETGLLVQEQASILPLLRGCVELAPTFLSLGNHESALREEDWRLIRETGVTVLDNQWTRHGSLWIGGLTSHYVLNLRAYRKAHPAFDPYARRHLDPNWSRLKDPDLSWLSPVPEGYTVLLSHHPEYYPLLPPLDLVLSAHAHGGQIRLFGRGLYAPGQGWFPRYTSGVHDGRLVISRGLTNTARVPRLWNPTEIVYIEPERQVHH